MARELRYEGRAFVFGDNIANCGGLMDMKFALARETDPEVLRHQVFGPLAPDIAARLQPGDLIVAGRRFAQGNPHIQGMIGLNGAGVGLLCESLPSGSFRNAINAGLPVLPRCPGLTAQVRSGQRLAVDFATGAVRNLDTGWEALFEPLAGQLLDIVREGGWRPTFRQRLVREGILSA